MERYGPAIGVDIGGTWMRAALVDPHDRLLRRTALRTPRASPELSDNACYEAVLDFVRTSVSRLRDGAAGGVGPEIRALGLAVAGVADAERGTIIRSVNLPFCEERPLAKSLAAATNLKTILVTDIAAATWAENGALPVPPKRFGHLRLGSGVGYAELNGGRIVSLPRHEGRHLDLLLVHPDGSGRKCRCGSTGCLEAYVSRDVLQKAARNQASDLAESCEALSRVVAHLQARLGADGRLVVGGGLLAEHPFLAEGIGSRTNPGTGGVKSERLGELRPARLGDDAGLIGAAALARLVS